ncbi:ABC transporter ATP-binding protein [Acholeplasma sp. OttesenSCG-928-E16]|nr:ABC transporter ATP-binding protein [Acholeplasma sp. OttesenSCG-928-E16]
MSTIKTINLTKKFDELIAVDNVNLTFEENKIYALLGRNGAGKSTLINMITNRLFPTSGEIYIDDDSATENTVAQSKIFGMTENATYPLEIRVKKCFLLAKDIHQYFDIDYAYQLSKDFDLNTNKKVSQLSTGYKGILKLILTLASNTSIMIFDEPVLGLDANYRALFYKRLLESYTKEPKTIIISTHLIDEVQDVIEHAIIINDGKIIVDDEIDNVLNLAYIVSGSKNSVENYIKDKKVLKIDNIGNFYSATLLKDESYSKDEISKCNLDLSSGKLQDLFICLTEKGGTKNE